MAKLQEDEDYHLEVFVDDEEDVRQVKARLLDVISDYDEAHRTYTVCLVWHKGEKAIAGVG